MVADLSALKYLKDYKEAITFIIREIEKGAHLDPAIIDFHLLLKARESLACAREEEFYINKEKAVPKLPSWD